MDVPADMLEQLKCYKCSTYLSRGPVYLEHFGAATCGECLSPDRPATRNKEYEAVVQLLKFPCKNKDLGCEETVGFSEVAHESRCLYRQYECPVLSSWTCEWVGPRSQLLQHCQELHPDHVLDNPCSIAHDLTTSSLHNYVLQAYQLLFLLLTKVCLTSGRIYHSVRLLDRDDVAQDFTYKVNFNRGEEHLNSTQELITQKGYVAGQSCLTLQEPTALGLNINNLLCDWDFAFCTVEVERLWKEKCCRCRKDITMKLYRDERGWYCNRCAPKPQICDNFYQGCLHRDTPNKCKKHKKYFCQQRFECYICDEPVSRGTLSKHYTSAHSDVTHDADSTWRATHGVGHCLVTSPAGAAVCSYSLRDAEFDLQVYIPVLCEMLCKFSCVIKVTEPSTGLVRTYTPHVTYNNPWDLLVRASQEDFPSWTCEFDVSRQICDNFYQGCLHRDTPNKCKKHKKYFCQQRFECYICDEPVSRGTLSKHYTSAHSDVTHDADATWRATHGVGHCLVTCPAGAAVCSYSLRDAEFDLQVYIPVLCEMLCKFSCVIKVTEPSTGLVRTYTPNVTYNNPWDLLIRASQEDFPSWTCEFDVSVNISKI